MHCLTRHIRLPTCTFMHAPYVHVYACTHRWVKKFLLSFLHMQDIDNRDIYKIYFYWILFVLAWNYHFTYVEWKLLLLHANNIDYLFKFALRCLNFLVMIILKVWKIWWDNADLANKNSFLPPPSHFWGFCQVHWWTSC